MKQFKCPACEEKFDNQEGGVYANILKEEICAHCYESETERPSTLVKWNGEKQEIIKWGEYMAWTEEGDDPPKWFWKVFTKRQWKATDGWRGYYETKFKNGFVKLAEGWVTGWVDESIKEKAKALELNELLKTGVTLPKPLFWLFESTSNVFSTASEIFVEKEDKKEIVNWLEKKGFTLEDLEQAFS